MFQSDSNVNAYMAAAAHSLHLAAHPVRSEKGFVTLHAAGDIEVHKAKDGRVYVMDLARTFPPEHPGPIDH